MKLRTSIKYLIPLIIFFFLFYPQKSKAQTVTDSQYVGTPDETVTLQDFQDSLSNKGEWVKINPDEIAPDTLTDAEDSSAIDADICTDYIWVPSTEIIYVGWSPYCDGYWGWTYWGWSWYPNYNWGWCTYHYGRWWHHHRYGWVWSPGYRWRHSWVTWCNSGRYVGWHPLPPRVHYRSGVAMMRINPKATNDGWVFVKRENISKPVDRTNVIDANKHTSIIKDSKQYVDNRYTDTKTKSNRSVDWNSKIQYNTSRNDNTRSDQSGRKPSVNYREHNSGTKTPVYRGYENYPGRYKDNSGSRYNNHSNTGSRSGSWNNGSRSGNWNSGSRSGNTNTGSRSNNSNNGSRSSSSSHSRN